MDAFNKAKTILRVQEIGVCNVLPLGVIAVYQFLTTSRLVQFLLLAFKNITIFMVLLDAPYCEQLVTVLVTIYIFQSVIFAFNLVFTIYDMFRRENDLKESYGITAEDLLHFNGIDCHSSSHNSGVDSPDEASESDAS